jgi:hypothetical protein
MSFAKFSTNSERKIMIKVILTAKDRAALAALAYARGASFDPAAVVDFNELEANGDDGYKGGWRTLSTPGVAVIGTK